MDNVKSTSDTPKGTSIWASTTKPTSTTGKKDTGKDDFMKLMLAQLQQQDPLKPMDDTAFIAQTAQFNALDEMTKLNKTLSALLDAQQLTEASGMIGKTISATDADGKAIKGVVTAASVDSGVAMLHLATGKIELDRVVAVASQDSDLPAVEDAAAPAQSVGPDASASG
jgi:flagellar basal-body rod modification protein FlgD